MSKKISRREMLGIGAATIAGVALSKTHAHATNHGGSGADYKPFRGYNPQRRRRSALLGEKLQRRTNRC